MEEKERARERDQERRGPQGGWRKKEETRFIESGENEAVEEKREGERGRTTWSTKKGEASAKRREPPEASRIEEEDDRSR